MNSSHQRILILFSIALLWASLPPANSQTSDSDVKDILNLDLPGFEKVKAALDAGDIQSAESAYLDYRRASNLQWHKQYSWTNRNAVEKADQIINHQILTFGYVYSFIHGYIDMGSDWNWLTQPVPPSDPRYSDEFTWTVARMPFWKDLADAYERTGDEKYAQAWAEQFLDFAKKNPCPPGMEGGIFTGHEGDHPGLWRALDISIRVSDSWPQDYFQFIKSPSFTPEVAWTMLKLMQDHGARLYACLQDKDRSGNQVVLEVNGLYTVAALFPELKDSEKWRDFAMDRITTELNRMVPPDGFEVELTPGYHLVSLDSFRAPIQLAKLNNYPVPDNLNAKIFSMYKALVTVMDQSGVDPTTNDGWEVNAKTLAHDLARNFGNDPVMTWAATGGKEGTPPPDSTMLPYAGFYCMRSGWKPDDLYLFFRAGPAGTGHEHEDMLEVVLKAYGQSLLFDAGKYPYDSSQMRRYSINSISHSTIMVDGKWQHRGPSSFNPPLLTNPWVTTPEFDFAAGTYDKGYQQNEYVKKEYMPEKWDDEPDTSVSHTRRVIFLRPWYVLLVDTVDGAGSHTYDSLFQLDTNAAKVDSDSQVVTGDPVSDVQVTLFPLDKDGLKTDIVKGQDDPPMGWKATQEGVKAIPTVRFHKEGPAPVTFATLLYPTKGVPPSLDSEPITMKSGSSDDYWAESLQTDKEKAEVALVRDGTAKALAFKSGIVGPLKAIAAGLVVRKSPSGDAVAGGWNMTAYSDARIDLTMATPCSLLVSGDASKLMLYNGGTQDASVLITRPVTYTATVPAGHWVELGKDQAKAAGAVPDLFPSMAAE